MLASFLFTFDSADSVSFGAVCVSEQQLAGAGFSLFAGCVSSFLRARNSANFFSMFKH